MTGRRRMMADVVGTTAGFHRYRCRRQRRKERDQLGALHSLAQCYPSVLIQASETAYVLAEIDAGL